MKTTVVEQLQQFFYSCGLGFILGLYYDVFRVMRLVMRPGKIAIFVQDMVFFVTAAVITFLFALAEIDGQLQIYLFLGEIIGFIAYYLTIGRVVMRFAGVVTAAILRVWHFIWWLVFLPFRLIGRLLSRPCRFLTNLLKKFLQKLGSNLKKGLKYMHSLLYNHKKA